LAKHDREHYPDIITSGEAEPYYTNSTQLPVYHTPDVFDALDHQDSLQTKYTGGTVFHAFLGEAVSDWTTCRRMVQAIARTYRLPYFTISPTFSVCPEHGYLSGEHFSCPRCGAEAEVYSRIVGYYRSVRNWNRGKKEEFGQRVVFGEPQLSEATDAEADARKEGRAAAEGGEGAQPGGCGTGAGMGYGTGDAHSGAAVGESSGVPGELFTAVPGSDPRAALRAAETASSAAELPPSSYLLFTKNACPNCPPVRSYLQTLPLSGREITVDGEEGMEEARARGVMAAPTVIVFDSQGDELARACSRAELEALELPGSGPQVQGQA
jgi:ribonucleoside-triphosphate reductase